MPAVARVRGGPWSQNCYVVHCAGEAVIIDPGGTADDVISALEAVDAVAVAAVATHGHFDHIAGAAELAERLAIPVFMHPADAGIMAAANLHSFVTGYRKPIRVPRGVRDIGEFQGSIPIGSHAVRVLETPGHTPGSICIIGSYWLISGDTLLADGPVASRLPGADAEKLTLSLALIAGEVDGAAILYPGHGREGTVAGGLAHDASTVKEGQSDPV